MNFLVFWDQIGEVQYPQEWQLKTLKCVIYIPKNLKFKTTYNLKLWKKSIFFYF